MVPWELLSDLVSGKEYHLKYAFPVTMTWEQTWNAKFLWSLFRWMKTMVSPFPLPNKRWFHSPWLNPWQNSTMEAWNTYVINFHWFLSIVKQFILHKVSLQRVTWSLNLHRQHRLRWHLNMSQFHESQDCPICTHYRRSGQFISTTEIHIDNGYLMRWTVWTKPFQSYNFNRAKILKQIDFFECEMYEGSGGWW